MPRTTFVSAGDHCISAFHRFATLLLTVSKPRASVLWPISRSATHRGVLLPSPALTVSEHPSAAKERESKELIGVRSTSGLSGGREGLQVNPNDLNISYN